MVKKEKKSVGVGDLVLVEVCMFGLLVKRKANLMAFFIDTQSGCVLVGPLIPSALTRSLLAPFGIHDDPHSFGGGGRRYLGDRKSIEKK
jgi:hypothetical protein